jgi:hypothetical protein
MFIEDTLSTLLQARVEFAAITKIAPTVVK